MAEVRIDRLSKKFGKVEVLKDINLDIKDGEFICLLGASGCGKSTLLRIIAGLEDPTSGAISIGRDEITTIDAKNRGVAMVFQNYALYPHMTVRENISLPLIMKQLSFTMRLPLIGKFISDAKKRREDIKKKTMAVAKSLGLSDLLNRKPAELSGGQRQRVALGRAMVRNPKVFLMDEPLSNLDAKMRIKMRGEISELHQALKTTFIYVTHDQEEAMTMSDRIALMMNGEILQVDTPKQIYTNPVNRKVAEFIGSPQINIIEGKVVATGKCLTEGSSIKVPDTLSGDIAIGIRPSRLKKGKNRIGTWRAQVTKIENLGSSALIHAVINGSTPVICKADTRDAIPDAGQQIYLESEPEDLIFFDEDGWNIKFAKGEKDVSSAA